MRTMRTLALLGLVAALCGCGAGTTVPSREPMSKTAGSAGGDGAPRDWAPTAGGEGRDKGGMTREPMAPAPMVGGARPEAPAAPREPEPQSGTLTAGSFDDNLHPDFFRKWATKLQQHQGLGGLPGKFLGRRLLVSVRDADGNPVGNALVRAEPAGVPLLTRSDGTAVFLTSWDQMSDGDVTLRVSGRDGARPVTVSVPKGVDRWEVKLPEARAGLPRNLDLAIVLDTTGSMGDEMRYLASEVKAIAREIQSRFPDVRQRYALILYKDQGDEYVTRHFDFTESVDDFQTNLSAQRAGGGGDKPEAMEQALEAAGQLRWRDDDTARVLFLVGDAPPHAQHVGRALAAVDQLRKNGVVLYPVACSGYDDPCEFVMRASGLLTGGQFLFLTDDSGVGNAHAEPHIPFYRVQRLDRMMIRMIASELSGKRVEPKPEEIIRTVGKPIN